MNRNEHADSARASEDRGAERAATTDASRGESRRSPDPSHDGPPNAAIPLSDDSALMRDTAVQGEDPQRDSRAPDVTRDPDHPTQPPAGDTPRAAGAGATPGPRAD